MIAFWRLYSKPWLIIRLLQFDAGTLTENGFACAKINSTFASYWELRHGHNGEKYYAALVYK